MEHLISVIESYSTANRALRDLIESRGGEEGRLGHFQDEFDQWKGRFSQFKDMAAKHHKQADELQERLSQEYNKHRQVADDLRKQIDYLKRSIKEQKSENDKLEFDLKDSVEKLQKLKYSSDNNNAYANAPPIRSNPFIQRLCNEAD